MIEEYWDAFVVYVNAYYAVQEAYDAARRDGERPAAGLEAFCRDANPFLWDGQSSAEERIYEDFHRTFTCKFGARGCEAAQGYAFARAWLASLEGEPYGTALVKSFDSVTDEWAFQDACSPIARQLAARASRLERTPQDAPAPAEPPVKHTPSQADIAAVIELLARGDEAFAAELRARLADDET